jgi:hypothetical protein
MEAPMLCPDCGTECDQIEVDIGVGAMYGPPSCPACGWSQPEISFPMLGDDEDVPDLGPPIARSPRLADEKPATRPSRYVAPLVPRPLLEALEEGDHDEQELFGDERW